jgi:hypothetical protein
MVGDYMTEPFGAPVRDNAVEVLAHLHILGGLDSSTLKFHKQDPLTTHKTCPGNNVSQPDMIERIHNRILEIKGSPAAPAAGK